MAMSLVCSFFGSPCVWHSHFKTCAKMTASIVNTVCMFEDCKAVCESVVAPRFLACPVDDIHNNCVILISDSFVFI